jgi:hypothetical protein
MFDKPHTAIGVLRSGRPSAQSAIDSNPYIAPHNSAGSGRAAAGFPPLPSARRQAARDGAVRAGTPFSFPITTGEAGIFDGDDGFYTYY